jgi:phytoene dehydrogenase-like protein
MKMNYDAIVIGSGIGGLISGGILSKYNNKRVLILEKHYEIGGLTHEFRRGPYSWDVGVHYLGRAIKDRLGDRIFQYLTGGRIKWNEIPGVYDKFMYPDFSLEISADWKKHIDDLVKIFPDEKKAIYKYFRDVKKGRAWYIRYFLISISPLFIRLPLKLINNLTKPLALSRVGDYLDKNIKNPRLKAALISRWGNQGLPPEDCAFCMQALIDYHYMYGAYFPDKGTEKIALMIEKTIEDSGGAIQANKEVTEIIIKDNKAVGVKFKDLSRPNHEVQEAFAPVIISNTGAWSTYLKLLPSTLKLDIQKKLKDFFPGYSSVTLFLGLKESPEKIGLNAANLWIYQTYDHNEIVKATEGLLKGKAKFAFVSFPSLKNNKAGAHTAEIVTLVPYSVFDAWKGQ